MMDVKIEYSPIYWIHNQTLVPTTTTTTQRSTSTTFQSTTKDRPLSSSSFNPLDKSEKASTEKVQSSRSGSLSFSLRQAIIIVATVCVIIN